MVERSTNTDDLTFGSPGNFSSSNSGNNFRTTTNITNTSSTGTIAKIPNAYTISARTRMVTERHAFEYNMRHKHRGIALIFNHEHFEVPTVKSRTATNVDCENLVRVLKDLDFDVVVHKDCNIKELLSHIKNVALRDHADNDCILIAILSHGELGYIYAKDTQYKLDTIWSFFTAQHCPTLAGKPKLFFIQACQGKRVDPGFNMKRSQVETDGDSSISYKIPLHADFLIAYSTIPGYISWRNQEYGSWFIQALCAELSTNGKTLDILTLLTFVCQRVAVDFESYNPDNPDIHEQKQIPCIITMLTRILRFSDKTTATISKALL